MRGWASDACSGPPFMSARFPDPAPRGAGTGEQGGRQPEASDPWASADATREYSAPGAPPAPPGPGDDVVPAADGGGRRGRQRTKGRQRQIIEWVVLILCALGIAFLIKTFLFQAFYIPSESMVPTLKVGDRVLVNKLSYHLHPVHRGDIVVFGAPPGTETAQIKDLVKRVIGLPGETIEGRADGHVYINGVLLKEPYLPKDVRSKQFGPYRVPAHSYYVLGDNRQFSKDSTVFGPIPRSKIVGRVFVRIWPLSRLGFL
jgi:signal peptidase I